MARLLNLFFCVSRRTEEKLNIVKKILNGVYFSKVFIFKQLKKSDKNNTCVLMLQLKREIISRNYNLFKVEFRRERHDLETCWSSRSSKKSNTANFSLMLCNYNNG